MITRSDVLALVLWLLAAVLIAVALTGVHAYQFAADCTASGGTHHASLTLSECRY